LQISAILASRRIHFVHGTACGVDPVRMRVTTETDSYDYDYLVIATGPHLACEEIPGLGPQQGYTHCIFTLEHAQKSREAWEKILKTPGPLVLGSTQLASCFGPYYELAFEFDHELRRRRMRHKVPITYLTSEACLGHMGIDGLGPSRRFMEDEFAKRDIKAVVSQAVTAVENKESARHQWGKELALWRTAVAFGFVFQSYNLIATATARENVEIPAIYSGMPTAARHARAERAKSFGVAQKLDRLSELELCLLAAGDV